MNTTTTTSGGHSGYDGGEEKHSDNHHDHHDDDDNEDVEPAQEWDEGGPSHCGYHSTVHDTLMTVGATVHSVVGDPPEVVDSGMKQVGNWFQEASYAIRDFLRGDKDVGDDAADALSSMHKDVAGLMGSPNEEKKTDDGYTPANTTQSTVNHSSADPSGTN
ncbi:hypothetical protein ACA910_005248 [Epithemia clementina (nom. ined.)]